MNQRFIGLMSGTSMDGIDAAMVAFSDAGIELVCTHTHPYADALRDGLAQAIHRETLEKPDDVPELHAAVGDAFRDATLALLEKDGAQPHEIVAIGSHGQTLRHEPDADAPYSLQIGDAKRIANGTHIPTVYDFRRADIEVGGQGAPLAPAFHEWLFRRPGRRTGILNIGGIANLTVLADDQATIGFDTGPGNTLMDAWIRTHREQPFDTDGQWAASGTVDDALLDRLLGDPYFQRVAPKSTGFEYFNLAWLQSADIATLDLADVQATLAELTARSIANDVRAADLNEVFVCGGGVHNTELMRRLSSHCPGIAIASTAEAGLDPDWVEAVAFAWLAKRRLAGLPGNLPSVTGADRPVLLGAICEPSI